MSRRLHVTAFGSGEQTMVFGHGFGTDQQAWRYIAPAFASQYRIILFDLMGAGESDKSAYDFTRYESLEGYASDLLELLHDMQLRDVVFVGHSVSGMIGVLAAIREPELFSRLVLLASSPCYVNVGNYPGGFEPRDLEDLLGQLRHDYLAWTSTVVPSIVGGDMRPELLDDLLNTFSRLSPAIAEQFARVTFLSDHRADLPRLTRPALVLQCAHDSVAPPEVGHYMHEHLPDSELTILNVEGHYPHLNAPVATITAMEQYLRAARGASAA